MFATDVESTRYALSGILLEREGDSITLAATDSRRLAVVKIAAKLEGESDEGNAAPVVPAKAMLLVERSISEDEQDVFIAIEANDVLIRSGNATISSAKSCWS